MLNIYLNFFYLVSKSFSETEQKKNIVINVRDEAGVSWCGTPFRTGFESFFNFLFLYFIYLF